MASTKRFVDNSTFNEKKSIDEFYDCIKSFNHFDENGIISACPECEHCSEGITQIDIPDSNTLLGFFEITQVKNRMNLYLEIHIQKLIEAEIFKIRPSIEKEIRSRFKSDSQEIYGKMP